MQVRLPNGKIISGIPEGTSKEAIQAKAIDAGIASESDFASSTNPDFTATPSDYQSQNGGISDFLFGKEGERSVFNAPELNELSFRALKSGIGGLLTGNVDDIQSIIGSNYPEAQFGTIKGQKAVRLPSGDYLLQPEGLDAGDVARFGVDVASFLPAGRIAGTSAKALGKGAAAAGAIQAAQEGVETAVGGDFDAGEVAMEAALGPVGQVAEPVFKALGSKAKDVASYVSERVSKPKEAAEIVGEAIKSGSEKRVIPELFANEEVVKAADDLGVDINPAHYSGSEIYREYELGLKAMPGSKLSAKEKEAIDQLSARADELISEFGGTVDKSALSDSVKQTMLSVIDGIKTEERLVYDAVEQAIPKSQKIIPRKTLSYLRDRIEQVGGVKFMSPAEIAVYKSLSGDGASRPTFQRLVEARRNVHSPTGVGTPFANTDKRTRDMLYNVLKEDERGVVGFFDKELLADYDRAIEIGAKRFKAQDEMVQAFGKDLSKSLFSGMKAGVKKLSEGDVGSFSKAMQSVPEDMRQEVAVSALNDVFTMGARTNKALSMGGFVSGWEGIKRNSGAMKELSKHVPQEAIDRMNKIYLVSKGILDSNKKDLSNPSGTARTILAAMNAEDGIITRLYRGAGKAAAAEGLTTSVGLPGAGVVGVLVGELGKAKKKAAEIADELLASAEFKRAVDAYMKGDVASSNKIIGAAGAARKWIEQQPAEVKRQVVRQGLMSYLVGDENAETEQ